MMYTTSPLRKYLVIKIEVRIVFGMQTQTNIDLFTLIMMMYL